MATQPIIKTNAITLRVTPFSNTSQIVTWLTPDHGKIATVIKGACRPKRDSGGQYDIGYHCELLFYERSHNGLYIFKECVALDNRKECRGDWKRTAAISYICHLASIAAPDGAPMPELYTLTLDTLNGLTGHPPPHETQVLWFELRLLNLLGIAPRLQHCAVCKDPIPQDIPALFSSSSGGLVCDHCAPRRGTASVRITADTLSLLRRWQRSSSFSPLSAILLQPLQQLSLCQSLQHFMSYHLELPPEGRSIAYQMLGMTVGSTRKKPELRKTP